jgi:hypothetical protein
LDRKYFLEIVGFSPHLVFQYDFHRLLRWLLKLSYNDDSTRPEPFETKIFVPYILGRVPEPPFHTNLFLGLITPSRTTPRQQADGFPEILEPESCGVGFLYLSEPAKQDHLDLFTVSRRPEVVGSSSYSSEPGKLALLDWLSGRVSGILTAFQLQP